MASAAWMGGKKVALAGLLVSAGCAATAQGIFVCIDAQGRRLTSDRPIAECLNREQREFNPSGTLRRIVVPPPTELERRAEEDRRRQDEQIRQRAQEEIRRDRILVTRYPTRATHDAEREAALRQTREAEDFARRRLAQLQQERKELDEALAAFRKDQARAPAALRQELTDNTAAMAAQQRAIDGQDEERQRIAVRYDTELAHLRQLWAAMPSAAP